jgi:penicillin-binding protein 1A
VSSDSADPHSSHGLRRWLASPLGRSLVALAVLGAGAAASAALLLTFVFAIAYSNLPPIDSLVDYRPKIPLRVWSADGVLLGEFGEERRDYVRIEDAPPQLKQAILAAEDDRFYQHGGVDFAGLARAVVANFVSGRRGQGGSTITMQIARTFYLPSEKLYTRKIYEIALAFKIEAELSKDRILEVYLNQIFLGQRAYGFGAAAQTYFGKPLAKLSVGEMAVLAGLPVAPSAYNPRVNPKRAKARQQYVLGRMLQLGYIDKATHDAAIAAPIDTRGGTQAVAGNANTVRSRVHAEFAAEVARQLMFDVFREETYMRGLNVYTTIVAAEQQAAWESVRSQVLDYDRRYGYRGPEAFIELGSDPALREQRIEDALVEAIDSPNLIPAVVLEASPKSVRVAMQGGAEAEIKGDGLRFAARSLDPKAQPTRRIVPGAVIRVRATGGKTPGWEIVQLPQVEAAFVAANAADGAVRALVGGFDFNLNKFNHVTQAWRQPGSSFKPFIYSAALEKGFMPSTLINDAPLIIDPDLTGGQVWEPKNYDGKFEGPLRLRQGLAKSKNLVSIRVLQAITPQFAQQHVQRFGFEPARHPPYLTMALGAGSVTPWQMLSGYAVFATGGYRVNPYLITRVTDATGTTLMEAQPLKAGDEANRVLPARNAFMMDSLLRDVVRFGTATKAMALKRADLAGKTGTTNDSHDAWFAGYGGGLVGVGWMGFDQPRPLGERETGGGLALPIWMGYMAEALKDRPEILAEPPAGIVNIGGEFYYSEFPPGAGVASLGLEDGLPPEERKKAETVRDQIF